MNLRNLIRLGVVAACAVAATVLTAASAGADEDTNCSSPATALICTNELVGLGLEFNPTIGPFDIDFDDIFGGQP